tara:strand:+ start:2698 stop:3333 length:636 start_codon:yes stop_codon:yes gene_type:complete
MTNFHEVRFPFSLALGARGGPQRRTDIVTLGSGREERNSPWAHSRRRWNAGPGVRTLDDLDTLIAFFEARHGQLYGFRFSDPLDHKSCPPTALISALDQPLGTGDGERTEFQLIKRYESGAQSYERPIAKPVGGSVRVAIDDVAQVEDTDFTVDTTTGMVAFAVAPGTGAVLTAGFEFDCPARFDADQLAISLDAFGAGDVPDIPIIEVKP